ncbi:MAG: hypothetical protein ACHREM_19175 [Polyangiales bacterium]
MTVFVWLNVLDEREHVLGMKDPSSVPDRKASDIEFGGAALGHEAVLVVVHGDTAGQRAQGLLQLHELD